MTIPTRASAGRTQFLSFQLGGLEYGLDFSKVKECRMLKSLERFAADGEIISGVAVSRGVIMPIVDMRVAVAGVRLSADPLTDVIILQLSNCVMGMVVDGVTDVVCARTGTDPGDTRRRGGRSIICSGWANARGGA